MMMDQSQGDATHPTGSSPRRSHEGGSQASIRSRAERSKHHDSFAATGLKAIRAARLQSKNAGLHDQIEKNGTIDGYDREEIRKYMSGEIEEFDVGGEDKLANMRAPMVGARRSTGEGADGLPHREEDKARNIDAEHLRENTQTAAEGLPSDARSPEYRQGHEHTEPSNRHPSTACIQRRTIQTVAGARRTQDPPQFVSCLVEGHKAKIESKLPMQPKTWNTIRTGIAGSWLRNSLENAKLQNAVGSNPASARSDSRCHNNRYYIKDGTNLPHRHS